MNPSPPSLLVENLVVKSGASETNWLACERLEVRAGECVGLIGPSGAGKTLLMYCAMGLTPPGFAATGRIQTLGEPPTEQVRRRFAFINQDTHSGFVPNVRVASHLLALARTRPSMELSVTMRRATELLNELGEDGGRILGSFPSQLSGGQLQRAQFAMAWVACPELLFADEMTASLDPVHAVQLERLFAKLRRQTGLTCFVASHDRSFIAAACDRCYGVQDGKVLPL